MSEEKPFSIEMDIYGISNMFLRRETKSFATADKMCDFYEMNKKKTKKKKNKKNPRKGLRKKKKDVPT